MIRTFHLYFNKNMWNVRILCHIIEKTISYELIYENTARKLVTFTPPKSGSTREKLLDIAEWLFADHGYDAVSVRHITEAADTRLK